MTAFEKAVRKRLIDMEKTPTWLCQQVSDTTGLYFDSSYLSKILRGVKKNPKIIAAIYDILKLKRKE